MTVKGGSFVSLSLSSCLLFVLSIFLGSCVSSRGADDNDLKRGQAFFEIGLALLDEGKIPDAISQLNEAVRTVPDRTDYRSAFGIALMEAEQYAAAEAEFMKILMAMPEDPSTLNNLAALRIRQKKFPEAIKLADQALAVVTYPTPELALANRAKAEMGLGQRAAAQASLERARRLAPENCSVRMLLAQVLNRRGDHRAAFKESQLAIAQCPDRPQVYMWEAYSLARMGQRVSALERYRYVIQRFPRGQAMEHSVKAIDAITNSLKLAEPPI